MKKRLFPLLLVFVMAIFLLPTSAFAAETEAGDTTITTGGGVEISLSKPIVRTETITIKEFGSSDLKEVTVYVLTAGTTLSWPERIWADMAYKLSDAGYFELDTDYSCTYMQSDSATMASAAGSFWLRSEYVWTPCITVASGGLALDSMMFFRFTTDVYSAIEPTPSTPIVTNPFTDLKETAFYYQPILWAYTNEITTGTSQVTFSPSRVCTRGQVVTFLWRAAGKPAPTATETAFTDLKEVASYYDAVLWAVEKGITNGISATTFGPNEEVTRSQFVTFLYRFAGQPDAGTENPFTDLNTNAFYYNAVLWAAENDITNGMTSTTFEPGTTCTRGQVVTFLYRYYN